MRRVQGTRLQLQHVARLSRQLEVGVRPLNGAINNLLVDLDAFRSLPRAVFYDTEQVTQGPHGKVLSVARYGNDYGTARFSLKW